MRRFSCLKWGAILMSFIGLYGLGTSLAESKQEDRLSEKRLIVRFTSGVERDTRTKIHHAVGARVIRELASISADVVIVTSRWTVAEAIGLYQADQRVQYAEKDEAIRTPGEQRDDEHGE